MSTENAPSSVEKRAVSHPDYVKWNKLAGSTNISKMDAIHPKHLETEISDIEGLRVEAKLYWLYRAIGGDVSGFSYGLHQAKPRELAAKYHISLQEAEECVTDAHIEVDTLYAALLKTKPPEMVRVFIEREITKLEEERVDA
jgi:hypothetical protein